VSPTLCRQKNRDLPRLNGTGRGTPDCMWGRAGGTLAIRDNLSKKIWLFLHFSEIPSF